MASTITLKTVKVSDKGQISIPVEIQRDIGIKKGDELVLIRKGHSIVLEKPQRIVKHLEDDLADLQSLSEASLADMWLSKREDVWESYLKGKGKKK
jgi:AbrB family looped-hinge helix DNA binding protein